MPNERLRDALTARGLTCAVIAERVEVDQKTVERWIASDRVSRRRIPGRHRRELPLAHSAERQQAVPRPGRGAGDAVPGAPFRGTCGSR